jgi:hypothetical protein
MHGLLEIAFAEEAIDNDKPRDRKRLRAQITDPVWQVRHA